MDKEKVLPEVDDEFARANSEFETAADLRADIEKRVGSLRKAQARFALRARTQEALAELVVEDVPEPMVASEMQSRLEDLAQRLQQQGMSLEQYVTMTGRSAEEITGELREGATQAVKVDLALRAVGEAEAIEVSDDEVDAELASFASQVGQDLDRVKARFRDGGQLSGIRSGLQKSKALDWLLDHVEIVDQHGSVIDRVALEADEEAEEVTEEASEQPDHELSAGSEAPTEPSTVEGDSE